MNDPQLREKRGDGLGLAPLVAMGVGGMVGGGIFSVLGLSVDMAGHAAPVAFAACGVIALLTGLSYARLGLAFRSDGGSFTYLERAFRHPNVAGLGGWLLIAGYVGTMALYAYTFGVYGSAMCGAASGQHAVSHLLAVGVLLLFLAVNLAGARLAGGAEVLIVTVKVLILAVFAGVGLAALHTSRLTPFFDRGGSGLLMGAALIFVAYEGFELIPNAVHEMRAPERDLRRSIVISVVITLVIYILVSLVAVGNLTPQQIHADKEYALAVAARPLLGRAGFLLIGLGAVLSTASAINATMFGTARLAGVMATDKALPRVFSHRERTRDVPWLSLCVITLLTGLIVLTGNLTVISAFASSSFLLIFAAINVSALRLRRRIGIAAGIPLAAALLSAVSWIVLWTYMWRHSRQSVVWVGASYLVILVLELLFSQRRLLLREVENMERRL